MNKHSNISAVGKSGRGIAPLLHQTAERPSDPRWAGRLAAKGHATFNHRPGAQSTGRYVGTTTLASRSLIHFG